MKRTIAGLTLAGALAGCLQHEPVELSAEARNELAMELRGYEAVRTESCISQLNLGGNKSVGGAIIFDGARTDTVYVNYPPAGCPELTESRALKTRTPNNRLCSGDIVEVFDPLTNFSFGACGLGEFTVYQRID